jgi:hypothetical protein
MRLSGWPPGGARRGRRRRRGRGPPVLVRGDSAGDHASYTSTKRAKSTRCAAWAPCAGRPARLPQPGANAAGQRAHCGQLAAGWQQRLRSLTWLSFARLDMQQGCHSAVRQGTGSKEHGDLGRSASTDHTVDVHQDQHAHLGISPLFFKLRQQARQLQLLGIPLAARGRPC